MTTKGHHSEDVGFGNWIGHSEERGDVATAAPVRALAATLGHPAAWASGAEIPPLWHWLYFLPHTPTADLAEDGHPRKGGFLPPIPKPRRMWAGSQVAFHAPLHIGAALNRVSTVVDVVLKHGHSGSMYFVKVRHETFADGQLAVVEDQDIVYRDPAPATPAGGRAYPPPAGPASWRRFVQPDTPLLFRYSALTFNSHRIHYDRPYATGVEGYPGLVVHGPLLATLMLDLVRRERPAARVRHFSFKAQKPVLDTHRFQVCGQLHDTHNATLWIADADGAAATVGTALLD